MIFVYLISFLLSAVGVAVVLGLTPENVAEDMMRLVSPEQTLRERVRIAKGRRRLRRLTVELFRIRDALTMTGKGRMFTVICASALLLMIIGCVTALAIGNPFLIPVFGLAFALIPFGYAKRTIRYYDDHIKEELETALSIITTSYIRSDDLIGAVSENLPYLQPPVKEIFAGFAADTAMITADIKQSVRRLKEKINDTVFHEWCDTLIACQDDRTLKDTLLTTVSRLTDVRLVNSQVKGMLTAARTEYFMMTAMLLGNLPLLYVLNRDWYAALMDTIAGKIVLAVCGTAILVTGILMFRFTKKIEYQKKTKIG